MSEVTQLLQSIDEGDTTAADELLILVYDDLRRIAAQNLAREAPGQTLQPTALVHEAYLRVVGEEPAKRWEHRGHFFVAAAEAMRRIVVEQARRKQAAKRGGGAQRVEYTEASVEISIPIDQLIDLNDALDKLAEHSPDEAELVKLRYFTGMTIEEAADTLGVTRNVAYRYWTYAKAFLTTALSQYHEPS
jgi:RNA polymerase sigma factor (TIGR02999 family)